MPVSCEQHLQAIERMIEPSCPIPRTAADLAVGDFVGMAEVVAIVDVEAVCSPRKGALPVPARVITWQGGTKTTLARDVKVAAPRPPVQEADARALGYADSMAGTPSRFAEFPPEAGRRDYIVGFSNATRARWEA